MCRNETPPAPSADTYVPSNTVLSKIKAKFWRRKSEQEKQPGTDFAALSELEPRFADILRSMYRGESQMGTDEAKHELDKSIRIPVEEGLWLYHLCLENKAQRTLEVGVGYGFSTLYFLAAAAKTAARHTSIDRSESTGSHGIGIANVRKAGMDGVFRFLEEASATAIPQLAKEGLQFDVIFLDGNHRFDYILADFALSTLVCKQNGIIVFDDMWMPSVRKVASFVRSNRKDFTEIPTQVENISAFRRTAEDQRVWTHFVDF
jgi:predicted O-methyltransferase YrrM